MALGDVRFTLLQTVNEVQRKLGLDQTGTLTANKLAIQMVDHVNDVVADLSDYGNWQEAITTAMITAVSGQRDYSIQTSAVVKNVEDIFFSQRRGPLRNVDIETMRILTRTTVNGQPTQFCIFGTDANANPNLRFRPTPGAAEDGGVFSVLYYVKPPLYTTSDVSVVIPFPSRVVVLGVLARYTLNESSGAPTPQYQQYFNEYLDLRREALNRFNYDTGWGLSFTPGKRSGRRNWR